MRRRRLYTETWSASGVSAYYTAFAYDNVDDCQTKVDNTGIRAYTYTVICCL